MTMTTTAIYEDGVLKPTTPLPDIPEHSTVRISIDAPVEKTQEELLAFLRDFPVCEELADAIVEGRKQPWRVEEF